MCGQCVMGSSKVGHNSRSLDNNLYIVGRLACGVAGSTGDTSLFIQFGIRKIISIYINFGQYKNVIYIYQNCIFEMISLAFR